ncbi:MAG: hypothetical protein KIH09_15615, partial [Candidatus Freyarchaeota archaeon]|nr:hypothetical protein [Candidatus Jordarchaeia archaeon]
MFLVSSHSTTISGFCVALLAPEPSGQMGGDCPGASCGHCPVPLPGLYSSEGVAPGSLPEPHMDVVGYVL